MRTTSLVCIVALWGCGKVVLTHDQGGTCVADKDCTAGTCADGVCCDRACDGTCEACVASKTGAADGTCAAVTVATDPDHECQDAGSVACGANGTGCNGDATAPACNRYPAGASCGVASCDASGASTGECDASGACVPQTMSCNYFGCAANACATTCATSADCTAAGFCNASHACAKRLRIALETGPMSCTLTGALPVLQAALQARGHTVTIVAGTDIQSAAQLASFDVVVTGAVGAPCSHDDRSVYDAALGPWVMAGGGLVASGWELYTPGPANFAALMPNAGSSYDTGALVMTPVGSSPIVAGLNPFVAQATYTPFGGAPKAGSTDLLHDPSNNSTAEAWDQGQGRAVFVGPLFIEDFTAYSNQALTDGSIPDALEMFERSIEWAGKSL
jgi:hypothetical protein